tara:strand:- start:806 stop:1237 length:432 start_codon:yes stop_codon:yes gene_type:complete
MEKFTGNILKFNISQGSVSKIRFLAQNLIDRQIHPNDWEPGKMKNELIFEYCRIKNIQIKELINKQNKNQMQRLKHHLNIKSNKKEDIKELINSYNYKKLDKIYIFLLQVSKNKIKNPKGNSKKIRHIKTKKTRKKTRKKTLK